ncbi:NAD(P)/FAD-dependent oxidoreductase [uncultured Corynebacterium sp.]|uniref:NAD(P)/FAD-dependent oxidoreductase n=1 Tax=uncultured Corynebacterium sp. TaxID=159447 RepID=UPI0025DC8DFE|nr:NAD(P)/FAD-dependent oxidoreductase [uncultured Corynebacterium sp.]
MSRIAVIGGGVAAHTLVKSLVTAQQAQQAQQEDAADAALTIDVFTTETHQPYRRPEVNKGILLDGKSPADVALPAEIFETPGVTFHPGTAVTAVDLGGSTRSLTAGGVTYPCDELVFATGAGPRLLEVEWLDGRDVHYVRTPEHAAAVRKRLLELTADETVVVIGGGVLGLEAASAAATLSRARVHVLELADEVCSRILPPTASRWLRDRHSEHGVTVTCGVSADSLPGTVDDLAPSVVIVSVGAVRDTMLAEDAGLPVGGGVGGGIIVDERGRTSVPGIFAVGDCVEIHTTDGRILRPEDDGSARTMAGIVAAQLGGGDAATGAPAAASFLDTPQKGWTKQYGHMLNILGATGAGEGRTEHVVLDSADELVVFTVSDAGAGATVVGVTTVGRSPGVRSAKNALGTVLAG